MQSDVKLKKIEERFCRQLDKPNLWGEIHQQVLIDAGPRITEESLLILDLGDITKKHAEHMEYLTTVRDGSEGELARGYPATQVIAAETGSKEVIPLYQELYSQEAPDFKSENAQIMKAIRMVSHHCKNRGLWVIDRGGDRRILFDYFLQEESPKDSLIRLVGDRNLVHASNSIETLKLACECKTPYSQTIVRQESRREKVYNLQYGYIPVKLPNDKNQFYLLVVEGFGQKPMMLLTNRPLRRHRGGLWEMVSHYLKRWSIEETIRFLKQGYDLENIRVLSYRSLQNMMALLLGGFYFLAVRLLSRQKLKIMTGHILK